MSVNMSGRILPSGVLMRGIVGPGEQIYESTLVATAITSVDTFSWQCPPGVTSVSVVCVGGGGNGANFAGGQRAPGGPGAVRIIWGPGRSFPNNAA